MTTLRGRWWPPGQAMEIKMDGGEITAQNPISDAADLPWILPGFVDNHCHILPTGLDMLKLPLGALDTREAMLDAVAQAVASTEPGEWVLAVHYDQNRFPDARHLTRDELDRISTRHPILLRHSNGHASIANSAALVAANVGEDEPDPSGGTYGRDEAGRLNGLLLEDAHERVTHAVPNPTEDEMVAAILAAAESMASMGIRTASDMMTGRYNLGDEIRAYQRAADQGSPVRFRLYAQWGRVFGPRGMDPAEWSELTRSLDQDRCRVAGIKIFADGAIASRTAAIYGAFRGGSGETDGQLMYSPDRLKSMIEHAAREGYQVSVHAIGDRATDLVLDGFEATDDPKRHRLEHAMILSDAQIERIARAGCFVTMQPEFLLRFGAAYHNQLGPERARRLKRFQSIVRAGIDLSFSSDRPIVAGNPWDTIRAATNRPPAFDPEENVDLATAIEACTAAGHRANGDPEGPRDCVLWDEGPI